MDDDTGANERIKKALARIEKSEQQLAKFGKEFWHRPFAEAVLALLAAGEAVTRESIMERLKAMHPAGVMVKPALDEAIARLQNDAGSIER